jgi:hypothetical protein
MIIINNIKEIILINVNILGKNKKMKKLFLQNLRNLLNS